MTAGSLMVLAIEQAVIRSTADSVAASAGGSTFTGQGTSRAVNVTVATNRVLSSAHAYIEDSAIKTTAGYLEVRAINASVLDATTLQLSTTGSESFGFLMAFNTVGWKPTNLLFAMLDALIGSTYLAEDAFDGEQPAETWAYIRNAQVEAAGAVGVVATTESQIDALVSNDATSAPAAFVGAAGKSVSGVLSSNMVSSSARAFVVPLSVDATSIVRAPTLDAAGAVEVIAADLAGISARTALLATVAPSNDAASGIINGLIGAERNDYQFTSSSGPVAIKFGQKVRVADYYDGPDADDPDAETWVDDTAGKVFRYMGVDATVSAPVDLGAQEYADAELWQEITDDSIFTESAVYALLSTRSATGSSATPRASTG